MKELLKWWMWIAVYCLILTRGHAHAPPPGAGEQSGPVKLNDAAVHNLGITTAKAESRVLQPTLELLGGVQLMPSKQARIGGRFEGRINQVFVSQGERVEKGQELLEIQPHTVGGRSVTLKSPLEGYIYSHAVIQGQTFNTNTTLMEIADDSEVYVRASTFDVTVLDQLKVGTRGVVKLDGYAETFEGVIDRIEPYLHHDSQTFNVYVRVPNADRKLKPNLKANLSVPFGEGIEGVIVPEKAVVGNEGNLFVFVQEDEHTYERRTVKLGLRGGDDVEVISGILPGEQVVLQGNYQLQYAKSSPGMDSAGADAHAGHNHGDHGHGDHGHGDHEDHGDHHHATTTSADAQTLTFIKGLWIGLAIGVAFCTLASIFFHLIGKLRKQTS